jgi:hypothetical protein
LRADLDASGGSVLRAYDHAARKQCLHVMSDALEASPWERGFSPVEHFEEPVRQEFGTL